MASSTVPTRRLSREDLEAILDSLVEGIVSFDTEGRVIAVNRAACEILELDKQEAMRGTCKSVFGKQFCETACTVREAIREGRAVDNVLTRLQTAGGKQKVLAVRTTMLKHGPGQPKDSVVVFRDATELIQLRADIARQYRLHNLVGKSKPMREIFELIEEVADADASVLIEGESGTGKELVARAIHHLSPRSEGPFVPVHCSALAEGVLESELFGHVKGAFTGATRDKQGRFEAAEGGTIFLDEIGDLAPGIQVKLLRVLQERALERVGGDGSIAVDIRIIAATHRPLKQMVEQGEFRQDLYYRLHVVPIHLPALRERREDLPLLVQHFVDQFAEQTGRRIESVSQEAMGLLLDYPWPGNVRELENAIEYAFVKAREGEIMPEHLPPEITHAAPPVTVTAARASPAPAPLDDPAGLQAALDQASWNVAKVARRFGISRTTIYKRIAEYGLQRPDE